MFTNLFQNSLSYTKYAVLFTVVSFGIANFGLNNIIQLSIPVLMFLYPLAITLIILALLTPFIKTDKVIYKVTTIFTIIPALFDFLNSLPEGIRSTEFVQSLLNFATKYLTGFNMGIGWIIPSCIGLVSGIVISIILNKKKDLASA